MFLGPLAKAAPWQTEGIAGVHRFLQRAWRLVFEETEAADRVRALPAGAGTAEQQRLLARTIDAVTRDVEALEFNTAISTLMVFARDVERDAPIARAAAETFVLLLAPFAPHLAEELWRALGHPESLAREPWPSADPALLVEEEVEIAVQVSGKLRARVRVPAGADADLVRRIALADPNVRRHVGRAEPRRIVYVPGRLVNLVPG
jgi:leucyl-tRNA synthetase